MLKGEDGQQGMALFDDEYDRKVVMCKDQVFQFYFSGFFSSTSGQSVPRTV